MKKIYRCLFEQSGTFKNEFKKFGFEAYDYDILNDFGETDFKCDLFEEIEIAFDGFPSIFDDFESDRDVVLAFFPCDSFEAQKTLWFQGNNYAQANWSDVKKIKYAMKEMEELKRRYDLVCKLVLLCIEKELPLIIENPYSQHHFLTRYFPVKPKIIDSDRTKSGDFYKKPSQFWFFNCKPQSNLLFEPIANYKLKKIRDTRNRVERSMISKEYARKFIFENIIENDPEQL